MVTALDRRQVSNGAKPDVDMTFPYVASVCITGVAPFLFHGWNVEAVSEKGKSAKGSDVKKSDNIESYTYRTDTGALGIPGKNFHAALIEAGRYMQDPRSPRKSLRDLVRAGIVPLTLVAPFDPAAAQWDYEDRQRVTVQRAGITRTRPAMRAGWRASFDMLVNTPEYFSPEVLVQLVASAGRLVGIGDFRPTYGRFATTGFTVQPAE